MNEIKQMETENQRKIRRAKWLVKHEGYTLARAAQTMSVTVKEVRDELVSSSKNSRVE